MTVRSVKATGGLFMAVLVLSMPLSTSWAMSKTGDISDPAMRQAFFGDLHIHTGYSFDAFAFGTVATPDDAYRYAQGQAIRHPGGFDVQVSKPLDFYGVTDHAIYLGVVREMANTETSLSKSDFAAPYRDLNAAGNMGPETLLPRFVKFQGFIKKLNKAIASGEVAKDEVSKVMNTAWAETIRIADAYYKPGEFTTFVGYEFTTNRGTGTLHRNVIFRSSENLPEFPYSRMDSQNPEDLWDWMDEQRQGGTQLLAIPHNSNGSDGRAFEMTNWAGEPIDTEYSQQRIRNEPLVEITQVKGTSETHPALSMNDEWANFEISAFVGPTLDPSQPPGSYVRDAFKRGLILEDGSAGNPYKFGVIGSSDAHMAAGSYEENKFFSKTGLLDANAALRGSIPMPPPYAADYEKYYPHYKDKNGRIFAVGKSPTWGASGLAGVWADANNREAIYDALARKETFATSGPRMRIRLFASYDFPDDVASAQDGVASAYAGGTPMGGALVAEHGKVPSFLVWATRDAGTAPLQRLQIIKGWTEDGKAHEEVIDVACSDGLKVDPETRRCPDNGALVDIATCSISADVGAGELKTHWRDPDYDPANRAFYYARVLENPSCRWSTWDAIKWGLEPRDNLPKTIQERAWSSPIWVEPLGSLAGEAQAKEVQ